MIGGVARRPARYLAPLALAAVVAATAIVVSNGLHSSRATPPAVRSVRTQGTRRGDAARHATPRFYVVRSGDTLSGISVKTGVSVARLESLNPRVNPSALQTGQRLRLR